MMDAIIVGIWLGVNSLAAVGSTGAINFMILGFCMGDGGFILDIVLYLLYKKTRSRLEKN